MPRLLISADVPAGEWGAAHCEYIVVELIQEFCY